VPVVKQMFRIDDWVVLDGALGIVRGARIDTPGSEQVWYVVDLDGGERLTRVAEASLLRAVATPAPTPTAFAPQDAAERLRALGWVCVAPVDPEAAIPEPQAGQVWVSPRPRVEARTVVKIGSHPRTGVRAVYFAVGPNQRFMHMEGWRAWAKKSSARPVGDAP
jgi:hypothetical protein